MLTADRVSVPPGITFHSAGPHEWENAHHFVSPRDLPVAVQVVQKPATREIQFFMVFREDGRDGPPSTNDNALDILGCDEAGGPKQMQVAFAKSLHRVAWIKVFGLDRIDGSSAEVIRTFLDKLLQKPPQELPLPAIATLTMMVEMVPRILQHHEKVAARGPQPDLPR
jgi:hypothetical protein